MKPLIALLCLVLVGCSHSPKATPQTASVRASGLLAKRKVHDASDKIIVLKEKVAPELKAKVEEIAQDLREATAQLDAQADAIRELDTVIAIQTAQVTQLTGARDAALTSRNRWRKYTFWLSGFALAALLWIFRKPIARLCGIPI